MGVRSALQVRHPSVGEESATELMNESGQRPRMLLVWQ